jgi:hypothetical protein
MLHDVRQRTLAKNLVNYSCRIKKGEKVWIDAFGIDYQMVKPPCGGGIQGRRASLRFSARPPCGTRAFQ